MVADARHERATGLSGHRAECATWQYQRRPDPQNTTLLDRLRAHATARPRLGYRRLHILLAREGVVVNTNACIACTAPRACKCVGAGGSD